MRLTPWIAAFWALVSVGVGAEAIASREIAAHWVSLVNTSLITIGGTVAILYQRKLDLEAHRRELLRVEHTKDVAAGLALVAELHEQLTSVINQRDEAAAERSELLHHLLELEAKQTECRDTLERVRCLHPGEPGHVGGPVLCSDPETRPPDCHLTANGP